MKIAYFDCFSGVSGDMVLGALVDAGVDFDLLCEALAKLPVDGFRLERRASKKHEIAGTKIDVIITGPEGDDVIEGSGYEPPAYPGHSHEHAHGPGRHLRDILHIIEESGLDPAIRRCAAAVFDHLAAAEGAMHGMGKEDVHLHEVSGMDAIADIVGACTGLHALGVEAVYASALPLGNGFVRCAHGRMPVPAPGALELLRGVPVYQTDTQGELVTPTGAAILKTVVKRFGPMPRMTIDRVGYGAGSQDFSERPNLLRLCVGSEAPGGRFRTTAGHDG